MKTTIIEVESIHGPWYPKHKYKEYCFDSGSIIRVYENRLMQYNILCLESEKSLRRLLNDKHTRY